MLTSPAQNLFTLHGKVALVSGGSRGLGLDMARGLGQAGAKLVITARKASELDDAAAQLRSEGIDVAALVSDLADPESLRQLVGRVLQDHGDIHVLVNNAGVTWAAPAEELTLEAWRRVVDVNLTGTWALTQEVAVRTMIPRRQGSVVMIASVAGLAGNRPGGVQMMVYNATKAGQINMTRSLAAEWGRHGIRVNAILPGWFPTRLTRHTLEQLGQDSAREIPLQRLGEAGDLAGPVVFLAADASRYVTGHALAVDGGMSAVL